MVGGKVTMSLLLPAIPMMGTTALGTGHDVIVLRKAPAAYGTGLPFIKKHTVTLSVEFWSSFDKTIVARFTERCNEIKQHSKKFNDYIHLYHGIVYDRHGKNG